MKKFNLMLTILTLAFTTISCGPSTVVERLQKDLDRHPEYSIILEDMREEGFFFSDYFHKYKIVRGEKADNDSIAYHSEITDWYEVEKKEYQKSSNYIVTTH